ncbi:T9SS type A sorting domain-containing protein [Flavobacterium rivuli]|uniref:T9SS type A sorting domain-containing protein n=1 Tax=Flavobacterium rivuli TaxID=498301 RepID=UPI0003670524|nr:T9SS type A sorting domain-containing protein [Flavobacterium rivuli]
MKKILILLSVFSFVPAFAQWEANVLDLTTNDLVYDAVTNKLYASIPSANGSNGNSIGIINIQTPTLENTVFIGSEPTVLCITDDGQYIYAGFSGSAIVRRFNIAAQTAGLQFALGSDSFLGQFYAADIEAVPGQPGAVAVSRKYTSVSPEFAGVAVYDEGVVRASVVNRSGGEISNQIEFKDSTTLFGYNNETTGFDFNRMAVNAGGVTLVGNYGNTPSGYNFSLDFTFAQDKAFFTNGSVVDATATPFISGTFANANGPVAYDYANNLACYASSQNESLTFKRYNPETFLLQDALAINGVFGNAKSIVTCGNGYYAFNTTDNKVVILHDTSLGIEVPIANGLKLYPNPASDIVKIDIANSLTIEKAAIFGSTGIKVYESKPDNKSINISNLSSGVYLVQLTDNNNNIYTKKIIKL